MDENWRKSYTNQELNYLAENTIVNVIPLTKNTENQKKLICVRNIIYISYIV